MLLAVGMLVGWLVVRVGAILPRRAHGPRHPVLVWSVTLPLWVGLAGVTAALAPSAGYLWTLPLLAIGIGLLAVPVANIAAVRAVSVAALAVAGSLWLFDTVELLRFMVPLFGRLPIITPIYAYPAVMLACGAMVVPPFIAAAAAVKPLDASVTRDHGAARGGRDHDGSGLLLARLHVRTAPAPECPRACRAERGNRHVRGRLAGTGNRSRRCRTLGLVPHHRRSSRERAVRALSAAVRVPRHGRIAGLRAGLGHRVRAESRTGGHRADDDDRAARARADRPLRSAGRESRRPVRTFRAS